MAPSTTPPFLWARWHCLPPSASGLPIASRPFLASLTPGSKGGPPPPPPDRRPIAPPRSSLLTQLENRTVLAGEKRKGKSRA